MENDKEMGSENENRKVNEEKVAPGKQVFRAQYAPYKAGQPNDTVDLTPQAVGFALRAHPEMWLDLPKTGKVLYHDGVENLETGDGWDRSAILNRLEAAGYYPIRRWKVQRDGDTDIRFRGRCLAAVSSQTNQGPGQSRWTEINIYRTVGDRYVVAIVGRTQWQGETDRYSAEVCESEDAVIDAMYQPGEDEAYLSRLAKEALEEAGIDHTQEVD